MDTIVVKIVELALPLTALGALKNMNIRLMPITINARHTLKAEGLQGSVYGDIELLQMKSKQ